MKNQHARIYGEDMLGVNHYFYKHWDMRGYVSGSAGFLCRISSGWDPDDAMYFDVYYTGAWHGHTVFNTSNLNDTAFVEFELPLTEEMMTEDFGLRFRNGMDMVGEYVEIDDFSLYGTPVELPVPALSEWGMILLAGLLLLGGGMFITRRRRQIVRR